MHGRRRELVDKCYYVLDNVPLCVFARSVVHMHDLVVHIYIYLYMDHMMRPKSLF